MLTLPSQAKRDTLQATHCFHTKCQTSALLWARRPRHTPARHLCSSSQSPQHPPETDDSTGAPASPVAEPGSTSSSNRPIKSADKRVANFVKSTATTFAPRPSTATRNPAYKGSLLYSIFGAQAWLSLLAGGLLSYNIVFPSDKPSIARLIGMWSIWMFTIPALRARECTSVEKEALNILFLAIPLVNVGLPFVWKSFPFIFTADIGVLGAVYLWKIGLPSQNSAPQ